MNDDAVLLRLARAYHSSVSLFERETGITASKWRTLYVLGMYGSCTQKQLAEVIRADPGLITRALKDLEAKGLVRRKSDPANNRFNQVSLLPDGKRMLDDGLKARKNFLKLMLKGISKQEEIAFSSVLDRIAANCANAGSAVQ
ncbi:MAG: MarR family winged helix-turn-helix transcriptional regulator [Lautropia sp.]